jgi:hypothetical protein
MNNNNYIPDIFNANAGSFPTSDHLPIMATFKYLSQHGAAAAKKAIDDAAAAAKKAIDDAATAAAAKKAADDADDAATAAAAAKKAIDDAATAAAAKKAIDDADDATHPHDVETVYPVPHFDPAAKKVDGSKKLPMQYALLDSQYYNNSKFFYNTSDTPKKKKLNIVIYD